VPNQPTVAAVVPLYNEISHVGAVVDALLSQDYPALTEIWLVDGQSADGTFEELQRLQVRDPRLRVLSNPRRVQAAAFNLACSHAQTDIIIRLDAHARYAADVIRRSVTALLATGAGGVGSVQRPLPSVTPIGQSIVAVHKSKFGIGLPKHRQDSASGWVDTVWNGCYWRHVIEKVGPLREDFGRTEDNDFNARVRALGYGLYLSPDVEAYYYPRQTLTDLWHQYKANGTAVVRTLYQNRQAIKFYHLVPLMFVASLVLLLLLGIVWTPALLACGLVLLCYISALLIFTIVAYHYKPGRYVLWLPLTLAVLHFSYGLGSIQGLLSRKSSQPEEIPASDFQGNRSANGRSS